MLVSSAFAQVAQRGQTLLYNGTEQKTPLEGVALSVHGAPSSISDKKGNFTLQFRQLHAGDKVSVRRVEKAGYEVFNIDALEQWYITGKNADFKIVLCETAMFNDLKERYRKAASQSYSERLKKAEEEERQRKAQGIITDEEYNAQIAKLEEQYERDLDKIENYIDRLARIDLSSVSKEEKRIITLVEAGRMNEAVEAYDKLQLIDKYKTERRSILQLQSAKKKIEKSMEEHETSANDLFSALRRQFNLLELAGGEENSQKALALLQGCYEADVTQYRPALEYAKLLIDYNEIDKAEKVLTDILPHCSTWIEQTRVRSLHASIYTLQHQYGKSESLLKENIQLCERNMKDEDESSFYPLITCWENHHALAVCYLDLKDSTNFFVHAWKMIDIAERVATIDATGRRYAAQSYFVMGNTLNILYREDEALAYLRKCLDIVNTLDDSDSNLTLRYRCNGLMATIYSKKKETELRKQIDIHLKDFIKDLETLYARNPKTHLFDMAYGHYQAAIIYWNCNLTDDCFAHIDGATERFRELAKKNAKVYGPIVDRLLIEKQNMQKKQQEVSEQQKAAADPSTQQQ